MVRTRSRKLLWSSAVLLCVGACASSGLSPLLYGVRHVRGGDPAAVFEAARAALIHAGYRIDRADADAGVITTLPITVSSRGEGVRIDHRLTSHGAVRRLAQIYITRSSPAQAAPPGDVSVYCKVVVQEQTTEAHRMFRHEHRASDIPGDTPIDREAATTMQQNTVWQTIHRDKAAERHILEEVLSQTASER
jgi:hypothetical protein